MLQVPYDFHGGSYIHRIAQIQFSYTHIILHPSVFRKSLPLKHVLHFWAKGVIIPKHLLALSQIVKYTRTHFLSYSAEFEKLKSKGQQQGCAICGRPIKTSIIKQKVGEAYYMVDKDECATLLKRFHSVYGNDFCLMLKE